MKAHELAKRLLDGPDIDVVHIWDGAARTGIEHVWETLDGNIATADHDMAVYYDGDRPKEGPTVKEQPRWCTPEDPGEMDHEI